MSRRNWSRAGEAETVDSLWWKCKTTVTSDMWLNNTHFQLYSIAYITIIIILRPQSPPHHPLAVPGRALIFQLGLQVDYLSLTYLLTLHQLLDLPVHVVLAPVQVAILHPQHQRNSQSRNASDLLQVIFALVLVALVVQLPVLVPHLLLQHPHHYLLQHLAI